MPVDRSKMGRQNRMAGKRWERQVAKELRPIFGNVWRGWQSRAGDNQADNEGVPCFWVECKYKRQLSVKAALAQARRDTDGRMPLAVCKFRNHTMPDDKRKVLVLVAMYTPDWYRFRRKVNRATAAANFPTDGAVTALEYRMGRLWNPPGVFSDHLVKVAAASVPAVPVVHFGDSSDGGFTVLLYDSFKSICESWIDSLIACTDGGNP